MIILTSLKLFILRLGTALALSTHKIFNDIESTLFQTESIERLFEKEDHREKRKKKRRHYRRGKFKKRQRFRQKHFALKGSHSKDHRYSHQKKIRRMHTNA